MPLTTRQRAAVNAVGIMACQGVVMVMNLLLVPFMIRHLGKDEYGVLLLVRSFIAYMPMLTLAVGPAVSRYVTHAIGRDDRVDANRYMSTGFAAMVVTAIMLVVVGIVFAIFLPKILALGSAARASQILLVFLACTAAVSYITAIFTAPLYAREKLAEINSITLAGDVLRNVCIVLTFTVLTPGLVWIGIASVVGVLISNQIAFASAFRVFPWLRISLRGIDRIALKALLSFSAFSTIATLVGALYYNSANFLIKWLYGPAGLAMITIYSVGACWDPWIRSAIAPLVRIINPRMTLLAAQDRSEDMRRLIITSIRYATALVAPVCVFVSVFATPILSLWLGHTLSPSDLALAARTIPVFLIPLIFAIGTSPSQAIFVAQARIAIPTIAALVGAIVNIFLGAALCRWAGLGLPGLAAGTGLTLWAMAVGFIPYYLKRHARLTFTEFFLGALARPVGLAAAYGVVCMLALKVRAPMNIVELGLSFGSCGFVYCIGVWLFVLHPHDRSSASNAIRRVVNRVRGRQAA